MNLYPREVPEGSSLSKK